MLTSHEISWIMKKHLVYERMPYGRSDMGVVMQSVSFSFDGLRLRDARGRFCRRTIVDNLYANIAASSSYDKTAPYSHESVEQARKFAKERSRAMLEGFLTEAVTKMGIKVFSSMGNGDKAGWYMPTRLRT